MALLKPSDPVEICTRCGSRFLESPDPGSGIEFDDTPVWIRDRELEQLRPLFEQLVESLG